MTASMVMPAGKLSIEMKINFRNVFSVIIPIGLAMHGKITDGIF